MRLLFAMLVLANVGLYMWATWYKEPPPTATPAAPVRPEIAPEKMRLLSEPGVKLTTRKAAPPPPAPVPTADGAACFALGPFARKDALQAALTQLQTWEITAAERVQREELSVAYRVYLPPFPSRQDAERKRRELTQLGFTDHAVIHEEGLDNAVSLGLFSVEANARLRMQQLAAKGVTAVFQALPSTRDLYWLDFGGEIKEGQLAGVAVSALSTHSWGADVHLYPRACSAPAATPNIP